MKKVLLTENEYRKVCSVLNEGSLFKDSKIQTELDYLNQCVNDYLGEEYKFELKNVKEVNDKERDLQYLCNLIFTNGDKEIPLKFAIGYGDEDDVYCTLWDSNYNIEIEIGGLENAGWENQLFDLEDMLKKKRKKN